MSKHKLEPMYAVLNEYQGGFLGTLYQIEDWLIKNELSFQDCKFWELGDEVSVKLEVVKE